MHNMFQSIRMNSDVKMKGNYQSIGMTYFYCVVKFTQTVVLKHLFTNQQIQSRKIRDFILQEKYISRNSSH